MTYNFISPYRTDKNIGKAINDNITQLSLNDDDWVIHCDQDVLWLLPDSKAQLIGILSDTTFDILGAITNRLGMQHQLVHDMFNETDILKHIEVAKTMQSLNSNVVVETDQVLAAFCLCFRVGTWKKLGGFRENSIQFDIFFSHNAVSLGMKLGIMAGVYLLHLYRLSTTHTDITHLLPRVDSD